MQYSQEKEEQDERKDENEQENDKKRPVLEYSPPIALSLYDTKVLVKLEKEGKPVKELVTKTDVKENKENKFLSSATTMIHTKKKYKFYKKYAAMRNNKPLLRTVTLEEAADRKLANAMHYQELMALRETFAVAGKQKQVWDECEKEVYRKSRVFSTIQCTYL